MRTDNTPLKGYKASTWEGGIRVPFLMQWKGRLPAGKVYDHPVIQLDIQPTAAAGGSVKTEWKLDGVNLLPLWPAFSPRNAQITDCLPCRIRTLLTFA